MAKMTIEQFAALAQDNLLATTQLALTTISNIVVTGTPVLHGSLRASWNATIGGPVANNVNINGVNRNRRNNITTVVNKLKLGDTYSLANGQPYAPRIEFEGWSKNKAPNGMMMIAVAQWDQIVMQAASGRA